MEPKPYTMDGFLPPGFRGTMGPADTRLEPFTSGLGVIVDGRHRFYPADRLAGSLTIDRIAGRTLQIRARTGGPPIAEWPDGARPMQVYSRWYGFSLAYPGCEIWEGAGSDRELTSVGGRAATAAGPVARRLAHRR